MYAQSIMLGDDELSINNFDEIMDWIIILFLYELCEIYSILTIQERDPLPLNFFLYLHFSFLGLILYFNVSHNSKELGEGRFIFVSRTKRFKR